MDFKSGLGWRDCPLISRQPVYDINKNIYGYGLSYQRQTDSSGVNTRRLSNLLAEIDELELTGGRPLFIPLSTEQVLLGVISLINKTQQIIEIPFDGPKSGLKESLDELCEEGYRFSLKVNAFDEAFLELLPYVDIVAIDVANKTQAELNSMLLAFQNINVLLLAINVNNKASFDICMAEGFKLFQGYFLSVPEQASSKNVSPHKANTLQLLCVLNSPETSIDEVEHAVSHDPKLCYRILLIVNSVFYRGVQKIQSIKDAIVRVGLEKIKNWAMILLIHNAERQPLELIERTIIRAKMCELIGNKHHIFSTASYYTVGILSTLDVLLNESMSKLLKELLVEDDIKAALLTHEGTLGMVLHTVIAYERGNFDEILIDTLSNKEYVEAYLTSIKYAHSIMEMWRLFKI